MGSTLLVLVPRYNQAVISFYFVCLFVCLFVVVVVQFYKNRENSYLDSGYQIARLHARGLMENLVPSLLSLPRLGCLGYFSARWLVGSIVKD